MPKSLIFIVGPTGVGKSDAGFLLAKDIDGEIVNADALSVYRGVDIASDKPSLQSRSEINHHVFDVVDLTDKFDVAKYRTLALKAIDDIVKRGKTPVIVGGSGMYVSVLLDGIFERAAHDPVVREQLMAMQQERGLAYLHDVLKDKDPTAASRIHPNDEQRIIRALEVVMTTGQPISALQPARQGLWGKEPIKILGLNRPRDILYQRVEARVEKMLQQGLVEEIRAISHLKLSVTAKKLIGIPETLGYLNGEYDLDRLKYLMQLHTRHLVKNQLTWFLRDKRIQWIQCQEDQQAHQIATILKSKVNP